MAPQSYCELELPNIAAIFQTLRVNILGGVGNMQMVFL